MIIADTAIVTKLVTNSASDPPRTLMFQVARP